jgi:HemY protein
MIGEILKSTATARALSMMGEAQGAIHGDSARRIWLERAAAAPRDAAPGADEFVRITGDGWRRLIHDYMDHGRLAPPPLEGPPPGIAEEALATLAPPAPPPLLSAPLSPEIAAAAEKEPPPTPEAAAAAVEENPDTDELLDRDAAAAPGVS